MTTENEARERYLREWAEAEYQMALWWVKSEVKQ